jgi:hypothetical protein
MKQYCLKLDEWIAHELEDYLSKENATRKSWNRIARNRVINVAIEFYLKSKKKTSG